MAAFVCPSCQWSGHPSFELMANGKFAAQCGREGCGYSDPTRGPNDFVEGVTRDGQRFEVAPAPAPAAAPPRPATVQRAPAPTPQASQPIDIIATVRARVGFLDAEIARLEGYKSERRSLARMLAAADKRPASFATLDQDIQ